jgi:hypothetical protein
VKHGILKAIRWNLVLASIVSALVATSWIAYNHEKGSPRNDLTPQKSNGVGLKARPVAGSSRANDLFTLNGATKGIRSAILPFKRIQIGPNEVDYVSEDVTIRHFLPDGSNSRPTSRKLILEKMSRYAILFTNSHDRRPPPRNFLNAH